MIPRLCRAIHHRHRPGPAAIGAQCRCASRRGPASQPATRHRRRACAVLDAGPAGIKSAAPRRSSPVDSGSRRSSRPTRGAWGTPTVPGTAWASGSRSRARWVIVWSLVAVNPVGISVTTRVKSKVPVAVMCAVDRPSGAAGVSPGGTAPGLQRPGERRGVLALDSAMHGRRQGRVRLAFSAAGQRRAVDLDRADDVQVPASLKVLQISVAELSGAGSTCIPMPAPSRLAGFVEGVRVTSLKLIVLPVLPAETAIPMSVPLPTRVFFVHRHIVGVGQQHARAVGGRAIPTAGEWGLIAAAVDGVVLDGAGGDADERHGVLGAQSLHRTWRPRGAARQVQVGRAARFEPTLLVVELRWCR